MVDYIRVSDYCKLSSINKSRIYRSINSGIIKTKKIDGVKFIDLEQLPEEYRLSVTQLQHHTVNLAGSTEPTVSHELIPVQTRPVEPDEAIHKQYEILKDLYHMNEEKTKYLIKSQEDTIISLRNEIDIKNKQIEKLISAIQSPSGKNKSSIMADFKILPHEEILNEDVSPIKPDELVKELKHKEQNYLQQISEYEKAVKDYHAKIEKLEKSLVQNPDSVDLDEKEKIISDLEYELNSNIVTISKLESDLSDKQIQIDNLTSLLEAKDSDEPVCETTKTLLAARDEEAEMILPDIPVTEDVETLKNAITVLRNDLIAKDKMLRSYKGLINENNPTDLESKEQLVKRIDALTLESNERQNVIDGLKRELNYYKDIINSDDVQKKLKNLEAELEEKQQLISKYLEELETKDKEITELKQASYSSDSKLSEDLKKDEYVLSHFRKEDDLPSSEGSETSGPMSELLKVLESKDNDIKNLEFELEIIKNTLTRKEQELEKDKQKIYNLTKEIDTLQKQASTHKQESGGSDFGDIDAALRAAEEKYMDHIKFLETQISELQLKAITLTAQLEESKLNSPWHKKL